MGRSAEAPISEDFLSHDSRCREVTAALHIEVTAAPNMEGKAAAVTTAGGHGSRGHENHRQVMATEVTAAEVTVAKITAEVLCARGQ